MNIKALIAFLLCSQLFVVCFYLLSKSSVYNDHSETEGSIKVTELGRDPSPKDPKSETEDWKMKVTELGRDPSPKEAISCCSIAAQRKLEDLCPKNQDMYLQKDACSCVDYMVCKLVVVTAFSSNHYEEGQDVFGTIHALLPHTKIIVYDLGLSKSQSEKLASYCNTEVRRFNFSKYPGHTRDLSKYAWKPFLIEEISKEFELFLYCDASCRVVDKFLRYLPNIMKFPVLPCSTRDNRTHVIKTTHDGMFKYLQMNMTRAELVQFSPSFEAGGVVYWANDLVKKQFIPRWVDCAMHIECIAPKGSGLYNCNFNYDTRNPNYAGCHRYDQSAFNAILIRDFTDIFNGVGRLFNGSVASATSGLSFEKQSLTRKYASYIKKC